MLFFIYIISNLYLNYINIIYYIYINTFIYINLYAGTLI